MKTQHLQLCVCLPLATAVVISAVWVIETMHRGRQLFVELESLNRERDRLQVDWGRLQLEESTVGALSQVEIIARESLSLEQPTADQIVVVEVPAP